MDDGPEGADGELVGPRQSFADGADRRSLLTDADVATFGHRDRLRSSVNGRLDAAAG
ncbi:hypothetical protein AKJ09_05390 [Labilithrix luteola]|uniref:Uncharacterized protein n=1 Tax=Labilithrix luteola TaxID=1391654 RepID=A0A0K1PZC5_9BACT|nr:hypothetical protein AKJ09_05390 [Labilithrix luteola]